MQTHRENQGLLVVKSNLPLHLDTRDVPPVGILGAVRHEGRNSRLLHYHETSGLAQTREEHQEIGESSARPRFDNAKSCLSVCHMLYVISDLNHNEKTKSKITKIR